MTITVIWIVIAVVAGVIDALTSSFFFFLFSIGAFAAAVGSAVDVPFLYQIIIFATISILLISFVYPVLKKKFKADVKKTLLMEEKYIGKTMISEKDIIKNAQIKVGGEYWTAVNSGEVIHKGDSFTITGIEGIKLQIIKNQEEK